MKGGNTMNIKKSARILAVAAGAVALVAALALTGCGGGAATNNAASNAAAAGGKTITVAAVPTPHAEVLNEVVKPALAEKGYTLVVKEFSDYVQPNVAVEQGAADANYFQHLPYLDSYNKEKGTSLVSVAAVHYEPFGLYAATKPSVDALADGDTIAIPNDTTNEARALLLLEQAGLIEVDDNAGITATPKDITSNPKNLKFAELEAAQLPRVLGDKGVALACINSNYAIEANLNPAKDALVIEDAKGDAAKTYANLIVTSTDKKDSEAIKALVEVINSDAVRDYINKTYNGAVLPIF